MALVKSAWRNLDVAIVGGGPAGLATALALRRVNPRLRLKVFEACPEYTPSGAGVAFFSNGHNALRALDLQVLHRIISSSVYPVMTIDYSDETGERMPWQYPTDYMRMLKRTGFAPGVVPWNSIRTALYASLPEGTVEFGCKVTGCSGPGLGEAHSVEAPAAPSNGSEEGAALYTLSVLRSGHCADGDGGLQELQATARYVVAADGYFSKIRRTVGDGRTPMFEGIVRWLGTVTQAELEAGKVPIPASLDPKANPEAMLCFHSYKPTSRDNPPKTRPDRALNFYMVEETEDSGLRFVWSLYAHVSSLEAAGETFPMPRVVESSAAAQALQGADLEQTSAHQTASRGARALQRALAVSTHMPADVRAMLAATPSERVMEFGMYANPRESYEPGAWFRDGLVLVGDAAHIALPGGQGANLAFEDAAVLGAMVRRHGLGPEALHAWERERMDRVRTLLHGTDMKAKLELIESASFEPLWNPEDVLASGEPLPDQVAAEVRQVLAAENGANKATEMLCEWSRRLIRETVESKLANRIQHETVEAPPGTWLPM